MTVPGHRTARLAEEILHELTMMLEGELKDPRLDALTDVTEVRVTPDLKHVRVYLRAEAGPEAKSEVLAGLSAAAGFIRHALVERLQLRRAPELIFVLDESDQYAERIEALLRKTKQNPK